MWQSACWATRKVLGIPKHPPYYRVDLHPELRHLPAYLDDRQTPYA